ncbi:MAG TPA: SIR2 family protein [Blastocatellia bacterium]|nr:SIR2 family protein [Blastocatellia bacterium]
MEHADEATIAAIAEKVNNGQCILFMGAGVHYPPPEGSKYSYPESERPPLGRALSERLAAKSGFAEQFPRESTGNLQRVSLYYETKRSRRELVEEMVSAVQVGKKPSPVLRALARLNFPLVITTNYDQLYERALWDAAKDPYIGVYSKEEYTVTADYTDATSTRPFVFKIHGDIQKPESIVVTDEDYIQFVLRMSDKDPYHPVPETFRYNFKRWPTLFVGYSLMDYNLRLLFKTLRWRIDKANRPNTYSVDPHPDLLLVKVLADQEQYVKFIAQDVWTFLPKLYRAVTGEEMPL